MIQKFSFSETTINGLFKIYPFFVDDNRGRFIKDYSSEIFSIHGINHYLKEVFYTQSVKGVIRALHFQREKQQAKLVRCLTGKIFDVVVDLRKESPTFKTWHAFDLCGDEPLEILVPEGCAHGYLVLEDSIVSYKCNEGFWGELDDGLLWNDKDLNIDWPLDLINREPILSEKDLNLQSLQTFISTYGGF